MTKESEIGVSLALAGGISGAIARAREEINKLEAALYAESVSVQRLRQAAEGAVGKSKAAPEGPTWAGNEQSIAASEPVVDESPLSNQAPWNNTAITAALPGSPMVASSVVRELAVSSVAQESAVQAMPVRGNKGDEATPAPAVSTRSTASLPVPANTKIYRVSGPATTGSQSATSPVTPSAKLTLASAPAQLREFAPQPIPAASPQIASARGVQSETVSDRAAFRQNETVLFAPQSAQAPVGSRQHEPAADFYAALVASDGNLIGSPSAPRLPSPTGLDTRRQSRRDWREPESSTGASGDNPAVSGAARPSDVANQPNQSHEGGIRGDVFLDGALVGRWMSRLLSREAERASVGPTGFDMRRGRLMPGATVGA